MPRKYQEALDELFIIGEWHNAPLLMLEHRPRPEALHLLWAVSMMKEILEMLKRVAELVEQVNGPGNHKGKEIQFRSAADPASVRPRKAVPQHRSSYAGDVKVKLVQR